MKLDKLKRDVVLAMADCSMNISAVAKKLTFHRNNVVYHVEQIKKKTGLDPRCFYDLIQLLEMIKEET